MAVRLIVDTPNILFRVACMNNQKSFGSDEEKAGLALHVSFLSVYKYYKRFRPEHLAFAFEGQNNWRKVYSTGPNGLPRAKYKGNRIKDDSMLPFFELIKAFKDVMSTHSAATCLVDDNCEADDVIAAYVEKYKDDEVIVVSGDKDFMQLYRYQNFQLIDPATGKDRRVEYEQKNGEPFDVKWFMFEKCVRGDKGDNVLSAYPRVRKTRIKAAFEDDFKRLDFMNEEWTNADDETFRVGDLFKENEHLMDLHCQPEDVRKHLFETLDRELSVPSSYSHFHFLKFLGQYGLNSIAENIHQYVDMLSCSPAPIPQPTPNGGAPFVPKKVIHDVDGDIEIEDRTKNKSKTQNHALLEF